MTFVKTSVLALAALAAAASLSAAAQPSTSQKAALEQAQRRIESFAQSTKGGAQGRLLLERNRVRGLIDDLDAGKSVDPAEIDSALQRAQNPSGF